MNQFGDTLKNFFAPLSLAQKVLFGLFSVGIIATFIFLFYWALRPDYALLFGSLSPQAAQTIVEDLRIQTIPYQVVDGGSSILVPNGRVHELRLKYASEGQAGRDYKGYELFDSNTLGMTDFMQRVNKKRALEGELARTINSLQQVEFSRVHLVLPERTPFQESRIDASASVILNLAARQQLRQSQIEGITALVAGSVEGLDQTQITILDQFGNKLSEDMASMGDMTSTTAQMKLKKETENYLMLKGQSMLDRVLGSGNAILRVNTEHDFERLSRISDLIDPESRIIISEERRVDETNDERSEFRPGTISEFAPTAALDPARVGLRNQTSSLHVRNYEVNTTREEFEKPIGNINRISASLLLNYKRNVQINDQGQETAIFVPYTPAEIAELGGIIRTAIGMRLERGDELQITQIQFQDPLADALFATDYRYETPYGDVLRWLLIFGAIAVAFALVFGILRAINPDAPILFKIRPEIDGAKQDQKSLPRQDADDYQEPEEEAMRDTSTDDIYRRKLTPEAQRQLEAKSKMFEEIKNFAEFKSEETANLVRSMMVNRKEV